MSDTKPLSSRAEALRRLFDRGHVLTRLEAAELLGVVDRQVSRLLRELREAGVPVQSLPDPRGSRAKAYHIEAARRRRGILLEDLDEEALFALSVAAEAASAALTGTPLETALRRGFQTILRAIDADSDDAGTLGPDTFELDAVSASWHFGGLASQPPAPSTFRVVRSAVTTQQTIRMDYRNGHGVRSWGREVEPLGLAPVRGVWLLVANCKQRRELREFNLARITNVRTVDRYFFRPGDFDIRAHFAGRFGALEGGEPEEVVLRVSPERATYFQSRSYHPSQEVKVLANGSLRVRFLVPGGAGLEELAAWIRSWGPHVVVEAPPQLAARVAADASATLAAYRLDRECPASEGT